MPCSDLLTMIWL